MRLLSPHAHDAALAATTAPTPTAKVMACYLATLLQTRFLVAVFFLSISFERKGSGSKAKAKMSIAFCQTLAYCLFCF